MKDRSHIIGRQIFEIGFSSREKSHELQGKISSAFNRRIADDLRQLFDRLIPENRLISVDSLAIDIGSIPFDFLDDELSQRITEQLEHELLLLLLHDNTAADSTEDGSNNPAGSYLKLLEYFLLRGTLPWWAGGEQLITPVQALKELLQQDTTQLKALILNIGRNDYVRSRLVYQFPEEHIRSVIAILEPGDAPFIFEYHTQVVQKQQEEQLVQSETNEFSKGVWIFILTYLLVDRGTHFNRKQFVKSTLMSMSAHFNISFPELLSLFTAALNVGSLYGNNTDSLQAIILELSIERDRDVVNIQEEQRTEAPGAEENAQLHIDILRYYLTFGSLPWWSKNWQQQEIISMLTELIKKHPKTAAALIRNTGAQEHTRVLIVRTFREDIVKEIIRLIEPDHAAYIFDYVEEIRTVHTNQPVLKAPADDFNTAIWQFILEFLLVERGSEFNRRMFLESNIRKLANRYNVKYRELLVFMVQSIAVAHHSSSRHVSLLQGLTALYKIAEKQEDVDLLSADDTIETTEKQEDVIRKMSLKNILYYWLKLGYLPWWADKPSSVTPAVLLQQLIDSSPHDAVLFLKYAGLKINSRRRMVYQMPLPLLQDLFRMFADGAVAVSYQDDLLNLIRANTNLKFPSQQIPAEILLLSMWNILETSFYENFSSEAFVRSAVIDLASWLQISVAQLLESFKKVARSKDFSELYTKLLGQFRIGEQPSSAEEAPEFDIRKLIASRLTKDDADDEQITDEVLIVLKYFLHHGKLPGHYRIVSEYAVNLFLKKLLLMLLEERAAPMKALLQSSDYPGRNLIRLHDLFSVSATIAERNLNTFLSDVLEKDIRLFLELKGKSDKAISALIDSYLLDPATSSSEIVRELFRSRSVSMRMAYYYQNDAVFKLIDNKWIQDWDSRAVTDLKEFHSGLSGLISGNLDKDRFDLFFRAFIFLMIGGGLQIKSMADFLQHFFRFLFERDRQFLLRLSSSINDKAAGSAVVLPGMLAELEKYAMREKAVRGLDKQLTEADALAMKELAGSAGEEQLILAKELEDQEKEEKKKTEEELDDTGTIYINNAGIVLLHPFLGTYFTRLGMIEKDDFITEEARHRAVHLLQYLVYGTEQHEEQELVLNKILCNMPLEEALEPGIVMTDTEKLVSAELLLAVLSQWDKLKNTTPESLQATFLQRKGGLIRNEENWTLRVEQKGYDVLLQTLPWGLGMIKTPWMTEFIYVEWM